MPLKKIVFVIYNVSCVKKAWFLQWSAFESSSFSEKTTQVDSTTTKSTIDTLELLYNVFTPFFSIQDYLSKKLSHENKSK